LNTESRRSMLLQGSQAVQHYNHLLFGKHVPHTNKDADTAVEVTGGHKLRSLREGLGCTMRDVESASLQIAQRLGSEEFAIPPSRPADIETKGVVPSIYRLYSMAAIYRRDYRELLSWYGVDLNAIHLDVGGTQPPSSHLSTVSESLTQLSVPVRLEPGFNLEMTTNLGRMIETWGPVPFSYLSMLAADTRHTYDGPLL